MCEPNGPEDWGIDYEKGSGVAKYEIAVCTFVSKKFITIYKQVNTRLISFDRSKYYLSKNVLFVQHHGVKGTEIWSWLNRMYHHSWLTPLTIFLVSINFMIKSLYIYVYVSFYGTYEHEHETFLQLFFFELQLLPSQY